jgi:hypothetical protein
METNKTPQECRELINLIFKDPSKLINKIAPNGLVDAQYIKLLINKDLEQDSLARLIDLQEFYYILGLTIYDIFSNNHEVITNKHELFDLGSFRGSGNFLATFLNEYLPNNKRKYGYMDFYMGTIWIKNDGDLLPFYEFIFSVLKQKKCDWIYSFPRMHLIDFSNSETETMKHVKPEDYDPESAMKSEFEALQNKRAVEKLQKELDDAFAKQFEEAKYETLIPVVQAYKNIYGCLPQGHPQKEFE